MNKKIYIIATGMNGFDTMTQKAVAVLEKCDVLIGAKRMVSLFSMLNKPTMISYQAEEIRNFIAECNYENIGVLLSGDCGFYSGAEKLILLLEHYDTEILCGISSPVYFCAKLNMKWSDMKFVSLHGRKENIIRHIAMNHKTFFLLGGDVRAEHICQKMCRYGMGNLRVSIGENLAMPTEKILCDIAQNLTDIHTDTLSVMVAENPHSETFIRTCIPDDEFIRDAVPMTKAEVRNISVSKLNIEKNSICWDIGCGTGSVSIEMAMRCYAGKVYAVDKKETAVHLTEQNQYRFRCDNVETIQGNAEDVVSVLPAPDCIFVGGSSGKLETIIDTAYRKNPNVRIIVTAVSLETLHQCTAVFEQFGKATEITQIAVTRTQKVGSHTMLKAENPVFVIFGDTVPEPLSGAPPLNPASL